MIQELILSTLLIIIMILIVKIDMLKEDKKSLEMEVELYLQRAMILEKHLQQYPKVVEAEEE